MAAVKGSGPKRSRTERLEALAQVAALDRMGYGQWDIARKLGVSQPQVCYDLKKLREQYRQSTLMIRTALVNEKIAQLAQVRQESYEAYQRSKVEQKIVEEEVPETECNLCNGTGQISVKEDTKVCQGCSGQGKVGGLVKRVKTVEADPTFLRLVLETLKQERELLGLDEATKVDLKVDKWDEILTEVVTDPSAHVDDVIEAEIVKQLEGPKSPSVNGTSGEH